MPGSAPNAVAVECNGVRYDAVHNGKSRGLKQNGGHVRATDIVSGKELWVRRAYKIKYGPKSPQKYDRFIRAMQVSADGSALSITDDSGEAHVLPLTMGILDKLKALISR